MTDLYYNKFNFDVFIIDFDDSFTFNIVNSINKLKLKILVISHDKSEEFLEEFISFKTTNNKHQVLLLGPGPGHPNEYQHIFNLLKQIINLPSIFIMGVCLGHQIIGSLLGGEVVRSSFPKHGEKVEIKVPSWPHIYPREMWNKNTSVQRYNSLVVQFKYLSDRVLCSVDNGEISQLISTNLFSMQFHPESVGTSYPNLFFNSILNFLYNITNEEFENFRNLQSRNCALTARARYL
jgi:anthranilate synthase component II